MLKILVITKRQYTNRDLIDDRFGRVRELPLQMALRKHKVYGLCLSYQPKKEGIIFDGPVTWQSLNTGFLKFFGLLRFWRRACQLAARADMIWAFSDSLYGILGYLLALKYRKPLAFDLYDNFEYFLLARLPIFKQFYRWVIKKCDVVTCSSRPLARLVTSYRKNKPVFVIENAAKEDLFKPMAKHTCRAALNLPQNVLLVGTAGALYQNRGIQFLFKAFHNLRTKYPDLHLALAGPRDTHIPADERVHDLGILPFAKVPLFFNALDIAVICNRENEFGRYCFPQKAREIMACDVPLIAARVGSMAQYFSNHPQWLFTPDDAVDLTRAIENRLQDRKTDFDDSFSWAEAATFLEAVFVKLCDNRSFSG